MLAAAMMWLLSVAWAHVPVIYVTSPSEPWCGVINSATAGDIILLSEGDYEGPCSIDPLPGKYVHDSLLIQPATDNLEVRFHHDGSSPWIVASQSEYGVGFLGLTFPHVPEGVAGISMQGNIRGTVSDNRFEQVEGVAVAASDVSVFVARSNQIDGDSTGTGIVVSASPRRHLVMATLDQNRLDGLATALHITNQQATVTDNYISANPSIFAIDAELQLHRNFVLGGLQATDSVVRATNNLLANGAIAITGAHTAWKHNTFYLAPTLGDGDHVFTNNVVHATDLPGQGNISCVDCFLDDGYSPDPDGPLAHAGVPSISTDFCRRARTDPPTVGAIEVADVITDPTAWPRSAGCPVPPSGSDDSDVPFDADTDTDLAASSTNCSCSGTRQPSPIWAWPLALLLRRKRWRKRP
jgi:hypothetical protein